MFLHPQKHPLYIFKYGIFDYYMKIGEALNLLKKDKGKLARLILLRKENLYVEEGKETKFNPAKLSEEINKKIDEIRDLKIKIQKTNLNSMIQDKNISLAEAIIKIGDIRSKIASLSNLFEKDRFSYLYRDKEKIEKIPQIDEVEVEKEIAKLVSEKITLDNSIQIANWNIELIQN